MNKVKPSDTNVEAEAGADVTKLSVDVVSGFQYMSCTCGQPILNWLQHVTDRASVLV